MRLVYVNVDGSEPAEIIGSGYAITDVVRTPQQAFGICRAGRADGILCERLTDIANNLLQGMAILQTCIENQWHFESLEGFTTSDRAVPHVVHALNELQRADTRWRINVGRQKALAEGRWLGGPAPFGFYSVGGKLHVHQREAMVIRAMKKMHDEGASLRTIAAAFNEQKIKTRKGKNWTAEQVRRALLPQPFDVAKDLGGTMD
jgi:site-specific DNA recombinase